MKQLFILLASFLLLGCNKFLDKPGDPTRKIPKTVADVQMLLDQPLANGSTFIGADEYYVSAAFWQIHAGGQRKLLLHLVAE